MFFCKFSLLKYSILIKILFFSINSFSQIEFSWEKNRYGGAGFGVTTDNSGNIFQTGYLQDNEYSGAYFFISKSDKDGNLIWQKNAQNIGSFPNSSFSTSIKVGNEGSIFVTGHFLGACDFDFGPGIHSVSSVGVNNQPDIFIAKYSSLGDLLWVKTIGGDYNDVGNKLVLDINNNPIIAGYFAGNIDFDPNIGVSTLQSLTFARDVFVLKLSSDGNFVWAKSFGGDGEDFGYTIDTDIDGNIYTGGTFSNWADFDGQLGTTGFITSNGGTDGFVCKMDPNGNFIWAKNFGGSGYDAVNSIDISTNDIAITGGFYNTVDFDNDPSTDNSATSNGGSDMFVCTFYFDYITNNHSFGWVKTFGDVNYDFGSSVEMDDYMSFTGKNVYFSGIFSGSVNFGSQLFPDIKTSKGVSDSILGVLSGSGYNFGTKLVGGSGSESLSDIYIYKPTILSTEIIVSGEYNDTGDFQTGAKKNALTRNLILEKFNIALAPLPVNLISFKGQDEGVNNLLIWETSSETNNAYFTLEKSELGTHWEAINQQKGLEKSTEKIVYEFLDQNLTRQLSYYRLKQTDISGKINYSKIISVNNLNVIELPTIYPNPASNYVKLSTNSIVQNVEIYNSSGKIILSKILNSKNPKIDLDSINEGNYIIQWKTDSGVFSKKLLIDK